MAAHPLIKAASASSWMEAVRRRMGSGAALDVAAEGEDGADSGSDSGSSCGSPTSTKHTEHEQGAGAASDSTFGVLRRRFTFSQQQQQDPGAIVAELRAQLQVAMTKGIGGSELRQLRDRVLEAEAQEMRVQVERVVDEAVRSDDYWKLQATMQRVVSHGLPQEHVARLKAAMATQRKQQAVRYKLKKAGAARDAAQLRTAMETALLSGWSHDQVKDARDALRAIEARETMKQELLKAVASRDIDTLRGALRRAKETGFDRPAPALLGEDPEEQRALTAASTELESRFLLKLQRLSDAKDADGLVAALKEAEKLGVDDSMVVGFHVTLNQWRVQEVHARELRAALQSGERRALTEALSAAEAAGVDDSDDSDIEAVREALEEIDSRERQTTAREEARHQLELALRVEDGRKVAAALGDAENAGLSCAEVDRARAFLRRQRSTAGASQELEEAAQAADLYRLRAALAAARGAGLPERDIQAAKKALSGLEAQARARREIEVASASRDTELLSLALEEAKRAGLGPGEVARASQLLRSLAESGSGRELRAAMASNDLSRLRAAASAATDSGMTGPEVDAAWRRLRALESQQWWRRQLQAATEGGDAARLQAAIQQAEAVGMGDTADLASARAQLERWSAQQQARMEMRLALAGGNPEALRRASRAAERAGLSPEDELATARRASEEPGRPPALEPDASNLHSPLRLPSFTDDFEAPQTDPKLQNLPLPADASPGARPQTDPKLQSLPLPPMAGPLSPQAPPTDPKLQSLPLPEGSPHFGSGSPAAGLGALPSPSRRRAVRFSA